MQWRRMQNLTNNRKIEKCRGDLNNKFQQWYDFTIRINKDVGIETSLQRLAKVGVDTVQMSRVMCTYIIAREL